MKVPSLVMQSSVVAGADGERLVHVELDRERRLGTDDRGRGAGRDEQGVGDGVGRAGHDGSKHRARDPGDVEAGLVEQRAHHDRPLVGRLLPARGEPPAALQLVAVEQADGDFGVSDVQGE
jgi:hypothetical protein